jgi:DNA-binding beta-propeller fold protein YncE
MRPHFLCLALLVAACNEANPRPAPSDRFIYPSGLVHRAVPGSTNGVLYVASANFDRCFDQGTVMAVDLDRVGADGNGLPALGTATNTAPLAIPQLNIAEQSRVYIQSYAGEMTVWERPGASPRLFVPARADGDFVHYIDLPEPTRLACVVPDADADAASDPGDADPNSDLGSSNDCSQGALSLTTVSGQQNDLPRAPAPFGVAVSNEGEVFVTHVDPADSPARSGVDFQSYLTRLQGSTPRVSTADFLPLNAASLPVGGSHSVAIGERYLFVSGRFTSALQNATSRRFLLRVLDRTRANRIIDPGVDLAFAARDARGLALTQRDAAGVQRLYLAVRSPDSLVVLNARGTEVTSEQPNLTLVGSVPMPDGPTQVKLVSRGPTRSELVLVSCSAAGVVAIYDPDVGQVVAQVSVGEDDRGDLEPQPFGIAVQEQGNSARVFVSNFGDGRVSVIDIPDLGSPQQARLVARLGTRQDQAAVTCQEVQQ